MSMELELDLAQEYTPSQTIKVSPRLVAANYILELSSQELQQAIANELADNPALELVDVPTCRVCGTELQGSICPRCIQRQKSGSSTYGPESHSYSLDEKGYLAVKVEDVAYEMDVAVDKVRAVLRVLQAQEPVGIGARRLQECLLIQIAHLEERGLSHPHARDVVT